MNDEIKYFEIRDRGTFVPVMCIRIINTMADIQTSIEGRNQYLLSRAGYAVNTPYVMLIIIDGGSGRMSSDYYDWNDRTFHVSHQFIESNWNELKSGDVVDVEYILGESKTKKISEQFETFGYGEPKTYSE